MPHRSASPAFKVDADRKSVRTCAEFRGEQLFFTWKNALRDLGWEPFPPGTEVDCYGLAMHGQTSALRHLPRPVGRLSPRLAAAAATRRWLLDCTTPQHTSTSALAAMASCRT